MVFRRFKVKFFIFGDFLCIMMWLVFLIELIMFRFCCCVLEIRDWEFCWKYILCWLEIGNVLWLFFSRVNVFVCVFFVVFINLLVFIVLIVCCILVYGFLNSFCVNFVFSIFVIVLLICFKVIWLFFIVVSKGLGLFILFNWLILVFIVIIYWVFFDWFFMF